MGLESIFKPYSVAVIGASREPGKLGYAVLKNIMDAGFKGKIYPVNPKADEILGLKCYPSIKDVPGEVELVVVIVPAKFTPSVIQDCGSKGVKAAIVISGGYSETGEAGAQLERQLLDAAKAAGIRIVGPNCQGVNSTSVGLCASWPLVKARGPISVISQSGTVLAAMGCWAETDGIGVSKIIALGNKCDVDETELLEYFAQDPETKVIALYMEATKNGRKFIEVAKKTARKKPIVVLKSGRTAKGAEAAKSHTRSLAGLDEVFSSAFKQAGVVRVYSEEELYDACKALASLPRPAGKNVAIITSSGGSGILTTDACEEFGLNVVDLQDDVKDALKKGLPPECTVRNPLDLTGSASSPLYDLVLSTILPSKNVDSVIMIVGDPMPGISEVVAKNMQLGKPIIPVMIGGGKAEDEEKAKLAGMHLPSYSCSIRGAKAVAVLSQNRS